MRQIFLDTETTGLSPESGDRIIEIGCVEIVNRRLTGQQPPLLRQPASGATARTRCKVHGLTDEFLADKPLFAHDRRRADRVPARRRDHHPQRRLRRRLPRRRAAPHRPAGVHRARVGRVTDSLSMAREIFPGKSNSLDALCKRFEVDNIEPRAARRAARRRAAGRGLHPHDARPGLARHRRRRRARPATWRRGRSTSARSTLLVSLPSEDELAGARGAARRDRQGERRQDAVWRTPAAHRPARHGTMTGFRRRAFRRRAGG